MAAISFRDVHGIAEELGVDVQTVRRWIQSGKLRAFKPGKEYRVREADLEEFLRAREVHPKAPRRSPFEPSLLNGLEEERRYSESGLGIESWPYRAMDSWVITIRDLIKEYEPIIGGLPDKPSAEEYAVLKARLVSFLKHAASINKAFWESGMWAAYNELWAAVKAGEPLTQDLEEKVREFGGVVDELNAKLPLQANEWLQRLPETSELYSGMDDERVERWAQEVMGAKRQGERVHKNETA